MSTPAANRTSADQRRSILALDRPALEQLQLPKLNRLLEQIVSVSPLYRERLSGINLPLQSLHQLDQFPSNTKDDLMDGNEAGYAANLTWPVDQYTRFHRTSGTRGRPMIVLDTHDDWQWWMEAWQYVLDSANVTAADRVLMAFSFGPFIGFWSAFDAVAERGSLVVPTGAMSTAARIELLKQIKATVVFCTPSYALHMAEVAAGQGIDLPDSSVQKIIVAGEPGGSIPASRRRIETAFGARVFDHAGASEIGPWGFADSDNKGLHVNEAEFVAEFLAVESNQPAVEGELSELVLTSLGRAGAPVIRYRTGDLVRPSWDHGQDNQFVLLVGGVLGRVDDMLVIRGVNIFPSSIEQILRGFPEIAEYRMTAYRESEMDQIRIEVEDELDEPERIADQLQNRLGLRVEVKVVPSGSLPRFEAKGKRFVDQRC